MSADDQTPHSVKMATTCLWAHLQRTMWMSEMFCSFPLRILSGCHRPTGRPQHRGPGASDILQLPRRPKPQSQVLPHGGLEHRLARGVRLRGDGVWVPAHLQPPRTPVRAGTHQWDPGLWSKPLLFIQFSVPLVEFIVMTPIWASLKKS